MRDLVKKKDGVLADPLIKPERDNPSLYRQVRSDIDRKISMRGKRRR